MFMQSYSQQGTVFWLTGLSGAGKTTIAKLLVNKLKQANFLVLLLDGDQLRDILGQQFGHTQEDRQKLSMIYARLCQSLSAQGSHIVCATISLFHETQAWNRKHIPHYLEAYIRVPLETLQERDSKKIYQEYAQSTKSPIAGLHYEIEEPLSPDIILNNYDKMTPENAAEQIFQLFLTKEKAGIKHATFETR